VRLQDNARSREFRLTTIRSVCCSPLRTASLTQSGWEFADANTRFRWRLMLSRLLTGTLLGMSEPHPRNRHATPNPTFSTPMNSPTSVGYRVRLAGRPESGAWCLAPGHHRIGRSADCLVRIDERSVSRRHAEIEVLIDGGLVLRDLGSTNGCWLGERRVSSLAVNGEFDLRVGAVLLEFDPLDAAAALQSRQP
jgi:hypothetical protein